MKRALTIACLAGGLVAGGFLLPQVGKVGYVDTNAILQDYPPAQTASQTLQASIRGFETEALQLQTDLDRALQTFSQQRMTMNPEAAQARESELNAQRQTVAQRLQELNEASQQRQGELFAPVMEKISGVIEEVRIEGNFSIIFDTASRAVVAADTALNLTEEVLSRLNAEPGSGE